METAEAEETLNNAMDLLADFRDDEAEEVINKFIGSLKSGIDGTVGDADRHYYWGRGLSLLEEPEQALLRFEKALQINPGHEGALWETTTLLLYELERPEGAKAILEQSLLPLRPGYALYVEALAASESLIRIQGAKSADTEEEDSA
jgi:tetratricopeptide (TPR) repeat protein